MVRFDVPFLNARKTGFEHPDTFEVPPLARLNALQVADLVKVCAYGERFWVQILFKDGDELTGRVDNNLLTDHLAYDDLVHFHIKNILQIHE